MAKTRSPWNTRLMDLDRIARGWSYLDLAGAAQVHPSTVTRFFAGTSQTPKVAKRIAMALDRPLMRYLREKVPA